MTLRLLGDRLMTAGLMAVALRVVAPATLATAAPATVAPATVAPATATPAAAAAAAAVRPTPGFSSPLPLPLDVLRGFAPPAEPWEAGNRGVDLAAYVGEPVYAATAGIVLYAGELAGRGVISIRDGTLRTTYEPVDPTVSTGSAVTQGELIGYVSDMLDSCGPPGSCLHWGAIRSNVYVDPLALVRAPPIRLLPIW